MIEELLHAIDAAWQPAEPAPIVLRLIVSTATDAADRLRPRHQGQRRARDHPAADRGAHALAQPRRPRHIASPRAPDLRRDRRARDSVPPADAHLASRRRARLTGQFSRRGARRGRRGRQQAGALPRQRHPRCRGDGRARSRPPALLVDRFRAAMDSSSATRATNTCRGTCATCTRSSATSSASRRRRSSCRPGSSTEHPAALVTDTHRLSINEVDIDRANERADVRRGDS